MRFHRSRIYSNRLSFSEAQLGQISFQGYKYTERDGAPEKINQDRGCIVHPVAGNESMIMYCVFDGHGPAGELVSEFVMLRLPAILEEQAVAHPSCFSDEEMEQTLVSTFEAVDAELGCVCQ